MHAGDTQAVTGDADVSNQSLVTRSDQGLYRAARSERRAPLVLFDQIVQLNQVDLIDAEAGETPLETGPGVGTGPITRLGRHEEPVRVAGQPGGDPQLGVAVGGRGVDVVHAELQQ